MTVRPMSAEELQLVLGWAADEGWNPGLDDAAAFHAADPTGFLIKEVNDKPVAAISVVNHDADFAFLGLYLCKPEFRGQGHGMDVWRAGIAHAGARCIGLDGVPDQQANYARSGFIRHGSTVRFEGLLDTVSDARVRRAVPSDLGDLIAFDANATGVKRTAFATHWFADTPHRRTVVLANGQGFAVHRRCWTGTKIGPLYATSQADALALVACDPWAAQQGALSVDAPGHDSPLAQMLKANGFAPVFETARMFTDAPPPAAPAAFQAIATMELG